jgi:hypothetical protein
MLKDRDTSLCEKDTTRTPSYFFNSFFVFTLMIRDGKYNYDSVRRWTKKVDVFALDKVCTLRTASYYVLSTCMYCIIARAVVHSYSLLLCYCFDNNIITILVTFLIFILSRDTFNCFSYFYFFLLFYYCTISGIFLIEFFIFFLSLYTSIYFPYFYFCF